MNGGDCGDNHTRATWVVVCFTRCAPDLWFDASALSCCLTCILSFRVLTPPAQPPPPTHTPLHTSQVLNFVALETQPGGPPVVLPEDEGKVAVATAAMRLRAPDGGYAPDDMAEVEKALEVRFFVGDGGETNRLYCHTVALLRPTTNVASSAFPPETVHHSRIHSLTTLAYHTRTCTHASKSKPVPFPAPMSKGATNGDRECRPGG